MTLQSSICENNLAYVTTVDFFVVHWLIVDLFLEQL